MSNRFECIFAVEPPDKIIDMFQYRDVVFVATTRGVYEIRGREDELRYDIRRVVDL